MSEDALIDQDFFCSFQIDPQGGLTQSKVDGLWKGSKYISAMILLGRVALQASSMYHVDWPIVSEVLTGTTEMPANTTQLSIVDGMTPLSTLSILQFLRWNELALWAFFPLALVFSPPSQAANLEMGGSGSSRIRMAVQFLATFSGLYFLRPMSADIFMPMMGKMAEFCKGTYGSLYRPAAALRLLLVCIAILAYIPFGLAFVVIKLEQVRFVVDGSHVDWNSWSFSDVVNFVNFANQMMSITSISEARREAVMKVMFAREDAVMSSEELVLSVSYSSKLDELIWSSAELSNIQKACMILTLDADDLQKLFIRGAGKMV